MNKLTKQNFFFYFAAFFCLVITVGSIVKTVVFIGDGEKNVLTYLLYLALIIAGGFGVNYFYKRT